MTGWFPHARDPGWTCPPPRDEVVAFHRSLDGYAPTPLVDLPALAVELGVGHVLAKDESARLGLPAFKALGASWAVHRIARDAPPGRRLTFVTATDGNHGRAVARYARLLGHAAEVVLPRGVGEPARAAIVAEGATVDALDVSYDEAVAEAARRARGDDRVLVQDTSWEGYQRVPQDIVDGYGTMLHEIDRQVVDLGAPGVDLVVVPTGVGSLLQAVLTHYRAAGRSGSTSVVAVEPDAAAALPPSLAAGHPVAVETGTTAMAGLNCGTPSTLAWPAIVHGLDGVAVVSDGDAGTAAADLAPHGVAAGPCGAAALAGVRTMLRHGGGGLGPRSVVVLLVTEGSDAAPRVVG